jgi:putative membrane protein insertion efficiency factor
VAEVTVVFIGGSWRPRRRRFGPGYGPPPGYDPQYPPGYDPSFDPAYGRRGFGYRRGFGGGYGGGGGSCLRDAMLVEGGCCLAEALGCGPQVLLVAPTVRRRTRSARVGPVAATTSGRIVAVLLSLIEAYQRDVSPRRGACCRFSPTCSHYAAQALRTHGLLRGLRLTIGRLLRCRPGAVGGADPVPGVDQQPSLGISSIAPGNGVDRQGEDQQ